MNLFIYSFGFAIAFFNHSGMGDSGSGVTMALGVDAMLLSLPCAIDVWQSQQAFPLPSRASLKLIMPVFTNSLLSCVWQRIQLSITTLELALRARMANGSVRMVKTAECSNPSIALK